jgi:thioredoxin reductase
MERCDIAIVGAGPYGLSAAAHLRRVEGLDIKLFGEPMSFWERHMPHCMTLRSPWDASHISDPANRLTLDRYRALAKSAELAAPIAVADFIKYGRWFHQQIGLAADPRKVMRIDAAEGGYRLTLEDGSVVRATRVIVAGGVQPFAHRPAVFDGIPAPLATHTSENCDFAVYRDKDVAVIGSGTSALEAAAFLQDAGARPQIVMRASVLRWPRQWLHAKPLGWMLYGRGDVGPAIISLVVDRPDLFRRLPRWIQSWWGPRSIRPSALPTLKAHLAGVPVLARRTVVGARVHGERVHLRLSDGAERTVHRVVLGTGYCVDVTRYPFLSPDLVRRIDLVDGYPRLDAGFETSSKGLHFLGAAASWSFGPLMRFVAGTEYAAQAIAREIAAARGRVMVPGRDASGAEAGVALEFTKTLGPS